MIIVLNRFHYDIIKKRFGEKSHLLFTDTDSLMYEMETPDLYRAIIDMKQHFDLSNINPSKPYYQHYFGANKAVLGKMKCEARGNPISDFVGLRPKMYSFEMVCKKPDGTLETVGKHRAKGIQRSRVARFNHQQYLDQIRNPTENYAINRRLGSRLHQIYGMEVMIIPSSAH